MQSDVILHFPQAWTLYVFVCRPLTSSEMTCKSADLSIVKSLATGPCLGTVCGHIHMTIILQKEVRAVPSVLS